MTTSIKIGSREVGGSHPTYFIADVAANHDGDLDRAKALVRLAAEAGADAAKFQNFRAETIVSDPGFQSLGQRSHQAEWKQSVFEVYRAASVPLDWTPVLAETCRQAGIDYMTAPYDFQAVDELSGWMPAVKIGSGDITWIEIVERIASQGKPVLLATGAASLGDVQRAVDAIRRHTHDVVLMQCNTNYTGSLENFRHINLNVLRAYGATWPDLVLGLSDHTPGHATVLGAVALGARVVEKHFTDDCGRAGPDHAFSMEPDDWRCMVERTRELELALGIADKHVADNELETVVLQRRCLRAARDISAGDVIDRADIEVLRPAPSGSIPPYEIAMVVGMTALRAIPAGEALSWRILGDS
jgi:sialic acid synthase SpsE